MPDHVTERPIYKWRLADSNAMHEYFSCVDWLSIVCKYPSALDMWDMFIDTIYTAVDSCVPKCKVTTTTLKRGHHPRVLWKLTCKKRRRWKKCKNSPHDPAIRGRYRDCAKQWQQEIRTFEMTKENDVIQSDNLGTFYKFVNKRLKYRSTIGALVDNSGNTIANDTEKANLLNEYFGSVGVVDNNVIPICNPALGNDSVLDTIEFNTQNVRAAICELKSNL